MFAVILVVTAFLQSPTHFGFDLGVARWAFDAAVAHDKDGKLDLAIERYDRAIALDPDYAEAYNNRGTDRRRKADLDGAIADYGEVIRLLPDSQAGYHNRGVTRQMKGDAEAALSDFEMAIRQGRAKLQELERDRSGNIRKLTSRLDAQLSLRARILRRRARWRTSATMSRRLQASMQALRSLRIHGRARSVSSARVSVCCKVNLPRPQPSSTG